MTPQNENTTALLIEVMESRSRSYRMFSRLYLEPLSDDDIQQLVDMDLISEAKALRDVELLAEGYNDMGRGLRRRHTGTRALLATDFTMCFDGLVTVDKLPAQPYASMFTADEPRFYGSARAEVFHRFSAAGVKVKEGFDLPADHLSFELEFMAVLAERTRDALEDDDIEEAIRLVQESQTFLSEQLQNWVPAFVERAMHILETRFYQGVLKATLGYLALDEQTLQDSLDELAQLSC